MEGQSNRNSNTDGAAKKKIENWHKINHVKDAAWKYVKQPKTDQGDTWLPSADSSLINVRSFRSPPYKTLKRQITFFPPLDEVKRREEES